MYFIAQNVDMVLEKEQTINKQQCVQVNPAPVRQAPFALNIFISLELGANKMSLFLIKKSKQRTDAFSSQDPGRSPLVTSVLAPDRGGRSLPTDHPKAVTTHTHTQEKQQVRECLCFLLSPYILYCDSGKCLLLKI